MSIVHVKLPRAGLGNQLFPLMAGAVFAYQNNLRLLVTNYHQLKIGPYLRFEKSKRSYRGYFRFQKSILREQFDRIEAEVLEFAQEIYLEPDINYRGNDLFAVYKYSDVPSYRDYFAALRNHRTITLKLFYEMLTHKIQQQVMKARYYHIGVHVRMGDFKKLAANDSFATAGNTRTPFDYFIDVMIQLRRKYGEHASIGLFSDGTREELRPLLKVPGTFFVSGHSDIVDLILLAKSEVIVTSAGSTFSQWAGFLSNAAIILHPNHIYGKIRNDGFEGTITEFMQPPIIDCFGSG